MGQGKGEYPGVGDHSDSYSSFSECLCGDHNNSVTEVSTRTRK